jgi:hypothetical protein
LSVTNITGSQIFTKNQLPVLKRLFLDFCPKIDVAFAIDNLSTFCSNVVYASFFGTLDVDCVDEVKRRLKTLKSVVVADKMSTERDWREFAKKRGLTLSNWCQFYKYFFSLCYGYISSSRYTNLPSLEYL